MDTQDIYRLCRRIDRDGLANTAEMELGIAEGIFSRQKIGTKKYISLRAGVSDLRDAYHAAARLPQCCIPTTELLQIYQRMESAIDKIENCRSDK